MGILEYLELLVNDIVVTALKEKHRGLGQRATGDWEESVETSSKPFVVYVLANEYTQQLTQGRQPGSLPPVDDIERWVEAKFGSSPDQRNIAWAVAQKIKNEGTTWYPEGSDLVDGVVTESVVAEINQEIGTFVSFDIAQQVRREFVNAFA